jgi:hypothetical protein
MGQKTIIYSKTNPNELLDEISKKIVPGFIVVRSSNKNNVKKYCGIIEGKEFKISKISYGDHSLNPVISGIVEEHEGGSKIIITIAINIFSRIIALIILIFIWLIAFFPLIQSFHDKSIPRSILIIFSAIFLTFFPMIFFKPFSHRIYLKDLFDYN